MKDSEKFPKLYPKLKKLIRGRSTPKLKREILNLIQKDYKKLKNSKVTGSYDESILNYLRFFYFGYIEFDDLTIKDQVIMAYIDYQYYFKTLGIYFDLDDKDFYYRTGKLPPRPKISKVALRVAISGISKEPGFKEKTKDLIKRFIFKLQENGAKFV